MGLPALELRRRSLWEGSRAHSAWAVCLVLEQECGCLETLEILEVVFWMGLPMDL